MLFSQRKGLKEVNNVIQIDNINDELKNGLWSLLVNYYWDTFRPYENVYSRRALKKSNREGLIRALWFKYFKIPIDTIPYSFDDCKEYIRKYFFKAHWYEIYDLIEFIVSNGPENYKNGFIEKCNNYLEIENSAYRFIDEIITEISSVEEIKSIEDAIKSSSKYQGVREHLRKALELLSDRKKPDYRNSIKESISSIESLAKQISGKPKADFSVIMNELESEGKIHSALKKAFKILYGYTSDSDKGIRHALLDEGNISKSEARFMLITCSAFVNYVIDSTK